MEKEKTALPTPLDQVNNVFKQQIKTAWTADDFVKWLRGYVEISNGAMVTEDQWKMICEHLDLCFTKITSQPGTIFTQEPRRPNLFGPSVCSVLPSTDLKQTYCMSGAMTMRISCAQENKSNASKEIENHG